MPATDGNGARHGLEARDGATVEALVWLAAAARELSEAVVFATVDGTEAEVLRQEISAIAARLRPDRARHRWPDLMRRERIITNPIGPVGGMMNPITLPLSITARPEGGVQTEFRLGAMYAGVPDRLHGGILALILDHLIGVAVVAQGPYAATATLDIRYRRPAPYGVTLLGQAEAVDACGRRVTARAKIMAGDGQPIAEAHGLLVRLPA